jgi:hypothetical protein
MTASTDRRHTRIEIALDPEYHAFVEKMMSAGICASRDALFEMALDALARDMEAHARAAATLEGFPNAENASLEELADALYALEDRRTN